MLNYEFPPIGGGAANAHRCLLQQFAGSSDLKVDVLTSAPKPGFFKESFADNVTIYKVGLHKKDLHFWRKTEVIEWLFKAKCHYRKLLRKNDYDFVHAFFGFPTGWLCYRSAKKMPYIISLRGSDVPGEHARFKLDYKILGPVFKVIWKKAAALVAPSEGLKDRALKFLPSVVIDVIPNGVDLDRFKPAEADNESETLRLLTVGRLSVTKRVEILIDAVEIMHREGCEVCFTIVGGGQMLQKLHQIVSEKNLANIIELTGRIDAEDMPQVYRQNDIFISASMQEGMSNAMLEATASGLPTVTTRCEGVDELIAENGIIVNNTDAREIADAVRKIADDRQLHKKMSIAARKQAQKFTWNKVASQYIELYHKILN
ncbi:MAG TPA: glycosyltransferase family 4 protein [Sedimentisphaerales bacterium]|nr:glycosyltransferase family 4 protein [Sedimentisphaerales bacterium]